MSNTLTALQYGVGPIGSRIVRSARERGVRFVGAVDVDPEKTGHDLGDVAGVDESQGVEITSDVEAALASDPDVVFHSTVSDARAVASQLAPVVDRGVDAITTCEELVYPWYDHTDVAERLAESATAGGATVLGTGINPGFVMDAMPAVLSTPMETVESVRVQRVQDAGARREPLQRKVGAGTDPDDFEEVAESAGHVGSPESTAMLADALGWSVDEITETIEPVVADERVETEYLTVAAGEVAGVHQEATGHVDGEVRVTLDLQMAVGLDSRDAIDFEGAPDVSVSVEGGYHGDVATSAVVTNCVPRVTAADPGLATMLDLQLPTVRRTV
jgi:hypothetical protein